VSPPKKRGVPDEKDAPQSKTDEANVAQSTVESQPAPANVSRLHSDGIKFEWSRADHSLRLTCLCFGVLSMHENKRWHQCHGDIHCRARHLNFDELIEALVEKVEAKP
jgi:hypothetical protein